ncbi:hypothetical protein ACFL1Z_02230 [Thermodesulfobacteriota bacterium]
MKKKSLPKETTLIGYIEADQLDEDENVTGIKIVTDFDDYTVDMNGISEDLLPFLDEEVEVSGIITEEKDGNKYIMITGYDILAEGPEDDFYFNFDEDYELYEDMIYGDSEDEYLH